MERKRINGTRAIVTGASSGIGRAIVLELAKRGARCIATARSADRLEGLRLAAAELSGEVHVASGDLTDADAREAVVAAAEERLGGLDLLVNNAGIGAFGKLADSGPDRIRTLLEINVVALSEMTRLSLPLLTRGEADRSFGRPSIVNIGSINGLAGVPHMSEYSAAKHAVTGFTQAIRAELARDGVDVLLVSPGTTETEFFDRLAADTSRPAFPEHASVTSEYVARRIVRAIERGRSHIIPYGKAKILYALQRLAPWLVDRILASYA